MIENCKVNDCQKRMLVAALQEIVDQNDDFRKGMPEDWEGDLLQDACEAARALLAAVGGAKND